MQQTPQPDQTHDAIVALLRDHPQRAAHDPSELNIAPGRDEPTVTTAPSMEPVPAATVEAAPATAAPREPAFEPVPKRLAVEPMALAPPVEPVAGATATSDIKMDAELDRRPARAGRGLMRFVTMVFVGIGATIAWQVYGETAREKVGALVPHLREAAPALQANAAEPQPPAVAETAAVQTAAAETPPAAAAAPAEVAAAAAPSAAPAASSPVDPAPAIPPEVAQKMEAMASEIAALKQTVEQLKAGQLQMNRDLAKTMEHQVKQKGATPSAKQTSAQPPQPQRSAAPSQPSQSKQASAAPAATPPRPASPYGEPQRYGQSQIYDRPPGYRAPPSYGRGYEDPYDRADLDRDVYVPPPSPNYQRGYGTVPRPPMPLQ